MTTQAHAAPIVLPAPRRGGIFNVANWSPLLYAIIDMPWSILAFTTIVTLTAVGASLTIIYVGVPILMFALLLARWAGGAQRGLASGLLGWEFATVAPRKRVRSGLWGTVVDSVTDSAAWRALAYFAVKIVLAPINFGFAITFYAAGLGMVTYPAWRPFSPKVLGAGGALHRGTSLWNGTFVDTWQSMTVFAAIGAVLLLCAPYVLRALLRLDFLAMRGILVGAGEKR